MLHLNINWLVSVTNATSQHVFDFAPSISPATTTQEIDDLRVKSTKGKTNWGERHFSESSTQKELNDWAAPCLVSHPGASMWAIMSLSPELWTTLKSDVKERTSSTNNTITYPAHAHEHAHARTPDMCRPVSEAIQSLFFYSEWMSGWEKGKDS